MQHNNEIDEKGSVLLILLVLAILIWSGEVWDLLAIFLHLVETYFEILGS